MKIVHALCLNVFSFLGPTGLKNSKLSYSSWVKGSAVVSSLSVGWEPAYLKSSFLGKSSSPGRTSYLIKIFILLPCYKEECRSFKYLLLSLAWFLLNNHHIALKRHSILGYNGRADHSHINSRMIYWWAQTMNDVKCLKPRLRSTSLCSKSREAHSASVLWLQVLRLSFSRLDSEEGTRSPWLQGMEMQTFFWRVELYFIWDTENIAVWVVTSANNYIVNLCLTKFL